MGDSTTQYLGDSYKPCVMESVGGFDHSPRDPPIPLMVYCRDLMGCPTYDHRMGMFQGIGLKRSLGPVGSKNLGSRPAVGLLNASTIGHYMQLCQYYGILCYNLYLMYILFVCVSHIDYVTICMYVSYSRTSCYQHAQSEKSIEINALARDTPFFLPLF